MQRTFNYTGRRAIQKSEVVFSLDESGGITGFNVEFRLDESNYPDDASVYVDAYYKETRQRFYFGKIARITPPKDRALTEIDLSGSPLFRVLIVDESNKHGLLLASGEAFRADDEDGSSNEKRESLLSVKKKSLGEVAWRVEFDNSGIPELCINSNIPNAIERIKSDPLFQSLILPAAFKQILIQILWNNAEEESESNQRWMELAEHFGDERPDDNDPQRLIEWVDEIIDTFCEKFDMCDRLINAIKEE